MPGPGELLLISVVLLLIFGASRLGQLGDALGNALRRSKPPGPKDEPK